MRVLVACEESQVVCKAFRSIGHQAYSCDIQDCSGGHPEWHIVQDVIPLLNGNCEFVTVDGTKHKIDGKWDMIIAHPPCTYLTTCAAQRLYLPDGLDPFRFSEGIKAARFFMTIYNADCDRIVIENPVPFKLFNLPAYSQIIQPYEFGHPFSKRTCLWLKGVPLLFPSVFVTDYSSWVMSTRSQRLRSKTFPGIAAAMAEQWG